jgi:hypothetical protein
MVKTETEAVFTTAMGDVKADIMGKSDEALRKIAENVRDEYESDTLISLSDLAKKHGVVEINVVNSNGEIQESTEDDSIGYDMKVSDQSREFVDALKTEEYFVQKYGPRGKNATEWRKYAAYKLADGGFIQVGYNPEQFHTQLNGRKLHNRRMQHSAACQEECSGKGNGEDPGNNRQNLGATLGIGAQEFALADPVPVHIVFRYAGAKVILRHLRRNIGRGSIKSGEIIGLLLRR